jgi:hypothetical protein
MKPSEKKLPQQTEKPNKGVSLPLKKIPEPVPPKKQPAPKEYK